MQKIFSGLLLVFVLFGASSSTPKGSEEVKWCSFEEALRMNEAHPKKILVDIVTSWCPNCRKMDKKTYTDPQVIAYLNEHFYAVRFDAEQKESVRFKEHSLKFMPDVGVRGVHELAYALVDGHVIYPSLVFLSPELERIGIFQEYQNAEQMLTMLQFIGQEHYKQMSFGEFSQKNNP